MSRSPSRPSPHLAPSLPQTVDWAPLDSGLDPVGVPVELALRFIDVESDPTVARIPVASAVMDPSRVERDLRRWKIRRSARARKSRRGWR